MPCYDSLMVLVTVWQWSEEVGERKLIQKLVFNEDRSCSDVYMSGEKSRGRIVLHWQLLKKSISI